jgi:hypothetical protein
MAKDDPKPPEDDSSDLVKFKRLAMRVVAVQKDAVYDLYPKMKPKPKATKKPAKKSRSKR